MPSDAQPTQPLSRKKQKTRSQFLDAASEAFEANGYELTPVQDICARAGKSIGALYQHFGSKEAVAIILNDQAISSLERCIAEGDLQTPDSPLQRVLDFGEAYLQLAIDLPAASRLELSRSLRSWDPSTAHGSETDALSRRLQRVLMRVAEDARLAMTEGQIRPMPVDELVILLWATWSGIATMVLRRDSLAIPPELAQRSLALSRRLIEGLASDEGPPRRD